MRCTSACPVAHEYVYGALAAVYSSRAAMAPNRYVLLFFIRVPPKKQESQVPNTEYLVHRVTAVAIV